MIFIQQLSLRCRTERLERLWSLIEMESGAMKKMISWNVNGLRACLGKGFLEYLKETDADIFCIQESKLQEGQVDLELPGYHQYWNYAEKKG